MVTVLGTTVMDPAILIEPVVKSNTYVRRPDCQRGTRPERPCKQR